MKETEGLLMIYLFDSEYAFNQEFTNKKYPIKNKELKARFKDYINQNNIDTKIPLVGYALEFPPIENDPGGKYLQGDYNLDIDEKIDDEEVDELEGISDINEI
jgi:hypothetical protein